MLHNGIVDLIFYNNALGTFRSFILMLSIHFYLFSFSLNPVRGKKHCPCHDDGDANLNPLTLVLRGCRPDSVKTCRCMFVDSSWSNIFNSVEEITSH